MLDLVVSASVITLSRVPRASQPFSQVKQRFQLDAGADGISATMDGFMLLEEDAVDVLRDNDQVLLQVGSSLSSRP
jgi:hypothetical protein